MLGSKFCEMNPRTTVNATWPSFLPGSSVTPTISDNAATWKLLWMALCFFYICGRQSQYPELRGYQGAPEGSFCPHFEINLPSLNLTPSPSSIQQVCSNGARGICRRGERYPLRCSSWRRA